MKQNIFFTSRLGFRTAILTTILTLWFAIAFGLFQPILHDPWHGIKTYADTFRSAPFLAWVIPCLFLTISFLTMMTCLYYSTNDENKIYGLLALVFALAYATILSSTYYIQLVVVNYNLSNHSTDGLSLWLFANPYPHSLPGALEGIGYGFMSLSLISASKVFSGDKLSTWLRRTFLFSGLTGLIVFTDPIFPLPLFTSLAIAFANALFLVIAFTLTCFWFRQKNTIIIVNDESRAKEKCEMAIDKVNIRQ
jgi:hypothetical protein